MHVMFVVNDLNYFAIHRQALAVAWLDRGWRVTLLSGDAPHGEPQIDPRITLCELPFARHRASPMRDLACLRILLDAIRTERPDVVHAFTIKAGLLAGLAVGLMRRKPALVLTFAGLGKIFEPSDAVWPKVRQGIVTALLRWIQKACSPWITFENEGDRQSAIRLGFADDARSCTVQGAGIDFDLFHQRVRPREGALLILMASRMIATKGVDVFVDAAQRLKGRAEFTLTGPRDDGDADAMDMQMVEEAAAAGLIDWRGATPVERMGDLLREHDVVVLPTRLQEGFPRSLLEAAACGCALVATRQPVIEQIVRSGETGWLLDKPDANHLESALDDAIATRDDTRAMGNRAAEIVSQMAVDTPSVVREVAGIYEQATVRRHD